MLTAFCGLQWREQTARPVELERTDGVKTGLTARAIFLPGTPPPYVKTSAHASGHSMAYEIEDRATGARLLVAPDVSAITPPLAEALATAGIVLFDGTFWSGDELQQVRRGGRTAEQMGHLPIRDGTLGPLRELRAKHKAYIHINNTKPILLSGSPERAEVEAAGISVAHDGQEFD